MPSWLRLAPVLVACLAVAACGSRHGSSDGVVVDGKQRKAPAAVVQPPAESRPGATLQSLPRPESLAEGESVGVASFSISPIARAVAAASPLGATPIPSKWVENKNYLTLVPTQPTSASPGKVEVLEVFWYGCPHCFHLEPRLKEWQGKAKAAYVQFRRMPVLWPDNPIYRSHARLYFTLEALGKLDTVHDLVFQEIHLNRNSLVDPTDPARTEAMQKAFLVAHGVTEEQFVATYRTPPINDKLQLAEEFTQRYKVTGVPTMVVAGKYVTDVGMAGGEDELFALVNDLAAAEHHR